MTSTKGFTLIEVVIFIVILSLAVLVLIPLSNLLLRINRIDKQTQATELAQQRMELILKQKFMFGFGSLADPCAGGTPPAICSIPAGYTVNSTISASWAGNADFKEIVVTVTGKGKATLKSLVANY